MIISASYRTDIPAFYGEWFRRRFAAGEALVANPYGGADYRVPLRAGVEGYVFWTRNAAPFLPALAEVKTAGLPFVVQYTVTGYPRRLEPAVPEADRALDVMRGIARLYGPRAVVWRYDPILVSSLTPPDRHLANFARLAAALEGVSDEVVTSFVQPYRKTSRRLAAAARLGGFDWSDPPGEEKRALLSRLAAIAAGHGMAMTLCTQPGLDAAGAAPAACIDCRRLSDIAGRPIAAPEKGNRPGCLCAESRDIGAYDSCAQGCVYCYAVGSQDTAKRRLRIHDADGEVLIPVAKPGRGE